MELKQKQAREIVQKLAKKYNLSEEEITRIVKSEFKLVEKGIQEGVANEPDTFKNIRLIMLGSFIFSTKKMESVCQKRQEKLKQLKEKNTQL